MDAELKKIITILLLIAVFLSFVYREMTGYFLDLNGNNEGLVLGGLLIGLVTGLYLLKAAVSHFMWEYD